MAGEKRNRNQLNASVRDRMRTTWQRGLGGTRMVLVRRTAAVALLLLAAVLALRPAPSSAGDGVAVVTATRDLPPGRTLGPDDLALRTVPADVVPEGALTDPATAQGRILSGAARSGEILTDVRLTGPALTRLATGGRENAAVPIPLPDLAVADLIRPGRHVDVIAASGSAGTPDVLARKAPVLAVRSTEDGDGENRLIIVGLPEDEAAAVASAALTRSITVTLR